MLYGKLGSLNWLALALGVAGAVGAVSAYFYNARCAEPLAPRAEETVVTRILLEPEQKRELISNIHSKLAHGEVKIWEPVRRTLIRESRHTRYYMMVAEYQKHLSEATAQPQYLRERKLFLDEVVELVNRLSPTCELQVSLADRHLTIRPVLASKSETVDLRAQSGTDLFSNPTDQQIN
jgi:hypothetical protein